MDTKTGGLMGSVTVEEALQRAADLEKQGCITPTAQALYALAIEVQRYRLATQYDRTEGA